MRVVKDKDIKNTSDKDNDKISNGEGYHDDEILS